MTAAAPVMKLEGMPRKPPKLMGGLPGGDQGLLMTLISLLKSKAAAGSAQLVPYATWIGRHPRKSKSQAGDRTCSPIGSVLCARHLFPLHGNISSAASV